MLKLGKKRVNIQLCNFDILHGLFYYKIKIKIKIKQLRKDKNKKFKINDFKKKFKNLKKFQRNQIPKQNKSKGGE